jgi:pyruvate dehydrogenase (quinone)
VRECITLFGGGPLSPRYCPGSTSRKIGRIRVEDPGDLDAAIRDVLSHDGPALLDVVTNPQELAMPPTITLEQVEGFSLWALRAVINGRGDELVELARSNPFAVSRVLNRRQLKIQ